MKGELAMRAIIRETIPCFFNSVRPKILRGKEI